MLSCLWAMILFDYGASHSFIAASFVKELGFEVETLIKLLHVSSPLGTIDTKEGSLKLINFLIVPEIN